LTAYRYSEEEAEKRSRLGEMAFRIGVDIGGTFTDFVLVNAETTGQTFIHKQLTTPADPSAAVIEGCAAILKNCNVRMEEVEAIVHGTTLVTNLVLERKGSPTGMLVTRGFSDILDIAREHRYDLYDLKIRFRKPLIPRGARAEVDERIAYDGSIRKNLDLQEVRGSIARLVADHGIKSIAVCFLHSYLNNAHEVAVAELVRREFPDLYVSISSEIFPHIREYERWTTTTVNASAQPLVHQYLARLDKSLRGLGFRGALSIMASNGGTIMPEIAQRFPVRMLESGPAAGALMSAIHGRRLGISGVLSFDMGGTTAKGALIRRGEPLKKYEFEIDRVHEFRRGSGLPVRIPVIDMIEIGAGGGSIAEVDTRGVIQVGPRSAGADPGPACYGKGDQPTLTDADLVLGYLNPEFFLGGRMALDVSASERVISDRIAAPLQFTTARAAWGIHEVINESVARAFRVHASERGFDYRNCAMTAFGGAGPLHAMRIARKLKIPRVIFPVGAGVMSAFGLLASPISFEVVKSEIVETSDLTASSFAERFRRLSEEARTIVQGAGAKEDEITIIRGLDMRYAGQGYEIEVLLPSAEPEESFGALRSLFSAAYSQVFGMTFGELGLEIVNWKVEVRGRQPGMPESARLQTGKPLQAARKGERLAYFPEAEGYRPCAVYDRYFLRPHDVISGPALIEENESTCVVGIGDQVQVDDHYNLIADVSTSGQSNEQA
jgi:N-methylhydantoinase A